MSVPTPPVLVKAFATDGSFNVIPVAPNGIAGRASWEQGFPEQTRIPLTAGGVPPSGLDFNGLFNALSAWALYSQAGLIVTFNQTFVDATGGYQQGAMLRSANVAGLFWINQTEGNANDPDTTPTGWVGFRAEGAGFVAASVPAGSSNNFAPTGYNANTGVLDINPNAGNATLTGLAAGYNGQRVIVSNVGATYSLTLAKLSGGSSAGNRFRAAYDTTLTPGGSLTLQYSTGAGLWIVLP